MLRADWRDWYRAQHDTRCRATGQAFEDYVTSVLSHHHDDFFNPQPAGQLGDGGCDGLAAAGTIFYASYGSKAIQNAERAARDKMKGDFERALSQWPSMKVWRFVSNAPLGPLCAKYLVEIQQTFGPTSSRPITCETWNPDKLWFEAVSQLEARVIDEVLPGRPGAVNVELSDVVMLLDFLGDGWSEDSYTESIPPVPVTKMDYNRIGQASRFEFNVGRLMAPRIDRWYDMAGDPDLKDSHGKAYRQIYLDQRRVSDMPGEILERLYTALAGPNFRFDDRRANAVYAVTSYFFDLCHLFERPNGEQAN